MKLSRRKRVVILVGIIAVPVLALTHVVNKPRALAVDEVPIAYWAWRTNAPSPVDLEKAFAITNSKTLFLRAGQFDLAKGELKRIRPLVGTMPAWVELHLVYNATPYVLSQLDAVDAIAFAETIVKTYREDLVRSRNENAQVFGLQLDLDYPNRLLPKYAKLLREVRRLLPPDTKLSVTGLPSWMATVDLPDVLAQVDFWIPQCYGGAIPTHISQRIPISSASDVAQAVSQARRLKKPFYAGLSTYSYAILYGTDGKLVELRGNIDPAVAENDPNLEQVDRHSFDSKGAGEIRYEYRAKSDVVLDGLTIQSGQTLVFDVPTAASLRASARAVRETGGQLLKGISLFRLPSTSDEAVLTISEVSSALADVETKVSTAIKVLEIDDGRFYIEIKNTGTASTALGNRAFCVDIDLPPGSPAHVNYHSGFHAYQTLCRAGDGSLQPCSTQRGNVLRLETRSWRPNNEAIATIEIGKPLPPQLSIRTTFHVDDGRTLMETFELPITMK